VNLPTERRLIASTDGRAEQLALVAFVAEAVLAGGNAARSSVRSTVRIPTTPYPA
jgi:hypothetical protein